MARDDLEAQLGRWIEAGLVDAAAAAAIRAHEAALPAGRSRWPVAVFIGLGGLLLGSGVLLYVAAHWDTLSPWGRIGTVVAMVAGLHVAATLPSAPALRSTLHAVGTVAFGAGVYLIGQVFNLQADWPDGLALWAAGALAGALLVGTWPQATLLAVLAPAWATARWETARTYAWRDDVAPAGLLLLALAYLAADAAGRPTPIRRALGVLGAIVLLPLGAVAALHEPGTAATASGLAWTVALGVPIAIAALLSREAVALVAAMALWVLVGPSGPLGAGAWSDLLFYAWLATAALGVIVWAARHASARGIDVGIAGFALTLAAFYSSSVMDKLGRSASLVGLGLLFLGGGYALDRARRRLIAGAVRAA
jgi:uncharacterized membrane protein